MSKANSENEWARAPPPTGPVWRTFAEAIYNPKEKSFLGRTPKRWAIVLTFYTIFYIVLGLLFAACMGGLFLTLDTKTPSYTLSSSLIGDNPGVAARPQPDNGFVITYDTTNDSAVNNIVKQLDEFLQRVIGLIYLVMYICIIIFFSICMCGLLATMDEKVPYFTLADSIIGDNPGMGHRPLLFEEGALIWYHPSNKTQVKKYVDNINEFLAPYENKSLLVNGGINQRDCGDVKPPREDVCSFNLSQLGPCTRVNNYGFTNATPCIIIKLNRLYAWHPHFYDDPGDLPANMPPDILDYINSTTTPQQRRKVWLSCKGERPADVEALGPLMYWPYPGLSEVYYPYDNTPGYLSPLVAVQLLKPKWHQIINIRCRAWARNIRYTDSLKERLGSTHLEIMID